MGSRGSGFWILRLLPAQVSGASEGSWWGRGFAPTFKRVASLLPVLHEEKSVVAFKKLEPSTPEQRLVYRGLRAIRSKAEDCFCKRSFMGTQPRPRAFCGRFHAK